MKLRDLFEEDHEEMDLDPSSGAGYSDNDKPGRGKLSSFLLRRKSERNNPKCGSNTKPDDSTSDRDPGDDPDEERYGAGLQ